MERLGTKLISINDEAGKEIYHWCPACKCAHRYEVPRWTFNGNVESPSFTPSMLIFVPENGERARRTICHYFVTDGQIAYCPDSPHKLSGQTVPLPDFPPGYGIGYEVS